MQKFDSIAELSNAPEELSEFVKGFLKHMSEAYGVVSTENFEETLGGTFYLVDSLEDLKEITFYYEGKMSNLFERFIVPDNIFFSKSYALIYIATNDGGGNTYTIPKEIVMESATVLASCFLATLPERSL